MKDSTKQAKRDKLLQYLSNPDNEFPNRTFMATKILGYAHLETIYQMFTLDELRDIEVEALEIRRKCYTSHISKVDKELLKKAAEGDVNAARLVYQRLEGWSEKIKHEQSGELTINVIRFTEDDG